MPRNLSESQLVQMGSKALSNVAGQFSKLSQSFNPKIRTGQKIQKNINENTENTTSSVGKEQDTKSQGSTKSVGKGEYSSDSDENECSIYESDLPDVMHENAFLPSVGIVMGGPSVPVPPLEAKDNNAKEKENVSVMSISSVTDNVTMPARMLDSAPSTTRSMSPAPEIHVQEFDAMNNLAKSSGLKFCHSAVEMRDDASPLGGIKYDLVS